MDSLFRDVSRLEFIQQLNIGQEGFSLATHFSDFGRYYFSRFLTNVTSAFKDLASTELRDLNSRHKGKINAIVKYPALRMDKQIIPIPKGMIHSYRSTLDSLVEILELCHARTIEHDLSEILSAMGTGKLKTLRVEVLDKKTFEELKAKIGKLFGKTGLSHSTIAFALPTPKDVGYVNEKLLGETEFYYPVVLRLNQLLKKVETRFDQLKFSEADKGPLSALLMTMAYRISIMSVVMDHLQSLEHGFVKSVELIVKNNG